MALPPTPNPILAVTLPIVLDKPPGTHAPTEALRLALLGVGAVHMAYLSSRRRVCVGVGAVGPADDGMVPVVSPMGVSSDLVGGETDAARLMGLSSMLRLGATRCLAVACRNPEETRSDAALGATMAVTLIDVGFSRSRYGYVGMSAHESLDLLRRSSVDTKYQSSQNAHCITGRSVCHPQY